jgi:protein-S-isoprenylcysteine O-methyltransferase Ste14
MEAKMSCTQIIFGAIVALFMISFVAAMVVMRSRGHDPKGTIGEHALGASITSGASLLWLTVALFFVFDDRSVTWFGRIALLDDGVVKILGLAVSVVGLLVGIAGQITMGESFRLAFPSEKTRLITNGIFGYVRNPCALGAFLLALGTVLVAPSWLAFLALVLNVFGYELKIRAEEAYLRETHGAAYEAYCEKAGRYLPRF